LARIAALDRLTATPPEWSIEPVPASSRTLGLLDNAALWGSLGFSLLLMVTGAFLTPALGLGQAVLVILIGAVIGNLMLATAAVIGADSGLPMVALLRAPLGGRGSYAASLLTLARNVAWGTFALMVMGEAAVGLSRDLGGSQSRPLWIILFGVLGTAIALGGPQLMARQWSKKFAFWFMLLAGLMITYTALADNGIPDLMRRPGTGGWPSFWQGVDMVIALPIAWLPLVADYSRFSRCSRSAFLGTFGGFFLATVWFTMLGVLYVPTVSSSDVVGFILVIPVGALAFLILLVLESDETFASVYSASVSLQSLAPRLDQRRVIVGIGALCTALALGVAFIHYENFLLLLGSVFVPLFGILAADHFLLRRRANPAGALYQNEGHFWYRGGMNVAALVVWLLGFLLYNWISPGSLSWWVNGMEGFFHGLLRLPFPLDEKVPWLSASIPAFLLSFVLYALVSRLPRGERAAPETASELVSTGELSARLG
jgi:NCS1 family nucleobase:cation symporter-1